MLVCMYICMYVYMYVCMYACMHVCMHVCIHHTGRYIVTVSSSIIIYACRVRIPSDLGKGSDGCPVGLSYFLFLDDVVRDLAASVIMGRLPLETTRVLRDVGHLQWTTAHSRGSWIRIIPGINIQLHNLSVTLLLMVFVM